ncbi:uncharacterized protein LOC117104929 isoform X1 [Anneissia japonica]|uniref:uncharacterized protein LOC117104929 isoform X1 n=1 Tax=Anneissia japonica TaxID=1529436 RepID=UPI0014256EC9|nr:uncharacterized protein LOC117104929 isoform X1 [Anneissia japonica]
MYFIWQSSIPLVFIFLWKTGDCKEKCMSDLKLAAVSNTVFDLSVKELRSKEQCIQNAIDTSWILQMNDTAAGISLNYSVKCQQGCQHCNDESLRPHPPQEITYRSTTGSDLCVRWKGNVSTNYTMYYRQGRGYCSDEYQQCIADRSENKFFECCPQNLHPVAPIFMRINYENKYMYVNGTLYWLRAQTIAIPNPLKSFTYQLLDDKTVHFKFEDPEDWNFDSFSLLDKRICQISPPVEDGAKCKTKTFQYLPNSWTITGLSYDTQYIYTAQCYRIEGRWSEEKSITFHTGGDMSVDVDWKEKCMSDLKLAAVSNTVFEWNVKELRSKEQCIQNAIDTSWILQMNDTEAGFVLTYSVKCQQGCQHCNDESLRPYPPQEITYRSTTGSDLCVRWKGNVSTNYTMYYRQGRGYCSDEYQQCIADRSENRFFECCPQNLHPVAPIYVRINYENKYMYVNGTLYWLRAQTIAIPNPLKSFTYQLLDDTTVQVKFEDPEDWNFDSFSLLNKRICQISPPVEDGAKCKTKTFQYPPNSWTIFGLSYDTQYIYTAQCYRIEGRWSEEKSITFHTGGDMSVDVDWKEKCMSDLKLAAVSNTVFEWNVKELRSKEQCIQNAIDTSWILQMNDTEAGIVLNYSVKCQQGCQHCSDKSLRPYHPQEITYRSRTGSDLCVRWKGNVSTNYTMYYRQGRGYCSDEYQRCIADRSENEFFECCPQNLYPVAPIYVRINYENKYMYVNGTLYWLRAQTIAIPNPLKSFTYQFLDDTKVQFKFEDPEDWNFDSFSLLNKRICQISPPDENGAKCKTKTFQYPPNSWTISGLSYDTQYIYTAQCYRIEGRWSEEKSITFHTGGDMSVDAATTPGHHDPVSTEMRNTSTSTTVTMFTSTQNLSSLPSRPVQNKAKSSTTPGHHDPVSTEMRNTVFASTKNKVASNIVLILLGFVIAAMIVVLFGAYRWMSKRLCWKIPEPNIPPIIVDFRVPNTVVEKEVFDELRTRNETLSVTSNNAVDSGRGTSEGTPDESSFNKYIQLQLLNDQISANHMHTHRGFKHEIVDDSAEDNSGSNHGDGVGISEFSFMNLIYENKVLVNENMGRKLHDYVNDDDSSDDDDDDDDDDDCDDGDDDGNETYDGDDEVNDNDDDNYGDVSGDADYDDYVNDGNSNATDAVSQFNMLDINNREYSVLTIANKVHNLNLAVNQT